ncbi:MAG: peptidoglycan DD-metalloendopeptidase family protein [Clostridiales bacterium]|nr:peptidoglycan DD-metalloendopeptidase family protein [Candidatus Apopatocola equi]
MTKHFHFRRLFALAAGMALLLALTLPAMAVSQYDIDQLALRRQALAEQAAEQAARIDKLNAESALFADRKLALDQCIETNRQEIELLNEQIKLYNQMLEEKSGELNEAIYAEEQQNQALRTRMRAMEETTDMSYLSVLLESNSLSELLSRIADINDITRYDRELQESYRQARSNKAQITREYQDMLTEQQSIQSELAARQSYLDGQIEAAQLLMESLSEDSENALAEYAAIDAALDAADVEIQQMIVALQQQYAAQRVQAAAASGGSGSGVGASTGSGVVSVGDLIWPLPSSSLVTSQFGNRDQPTAGASTNHQGLDINANEGDRVISAAGGTVISAGQLGGYGNCVIVDHGNGVQTVYAHLSSVNVSVGQSVGQGDTLGGAGATGIATGNHLHYEVRANGVNTDPSQYYSDYSVWGG